MKNNLMNSAPFILSCVIFYLQVEIRCIYWRYCILLVDDFSEEFNLSDSYIFVALITSVS